MRPGLMIGVVFCASLVACKREVPTEAEPAPTLAVKPTESTIVVSPVVPTNVMTPVVSAIPMIPSAYASSFAHAPAPISPEEQERANRYVGGLARGRKATRAKDYASAVKYFDESLAVEPGDARALSERGYAHLLSGEYVAAAKDLEAAAKRAGNADLLRQILFNQAAVAEKQGDTNAAAAFLAQREELASAKKSKGRDCEISISRPGTMPLVFKTFRDAWKEIKTAHFRHWDRSPEPLESPKIDDKADEDTVRKALVGTTSPGDGAWTITTREISLEVSHVLFVRGKEILVLPALGGFQMGRCPFGDGAPSVVESPVPRIQVDQEILEMGYMCSAPNGDDFRPCDEVPNGTPVQSYCYWMGSKFRTRILDPKTFAVVLDIEESVEAKGTTTFQAARPRAVITVQPDAVLVTGCGVDKRETLP